MATTVINKHHKLPYDISIGRDGKWGNPFSHMEGTTAQFKVDTREEAVINHRKWILKQPNLMLALHELKDKILGCTCYPALCHGQTLIDLIDNTFYVVIAGSRGFNNYGLMEKEMDYLLSQRTENIVVVSGQAPGADRMGERYAKNRGYEIAEMPADWQPARLGGATDRGAGHKRNRDMAMLIRNLQGGAVLYWDGISPGTAGMNKICEELNISKRIVNY